MKSLFLTLTLIGLCFCIAVVILFEQSTPAPQNQVKNTTPKAPTQIRQESSSTKKRVMIKEEVQTSEIVTVASTKDKNHNESKPLATNEAQSIKVPPVSEKSTTSSSNIGEIDLPEPLALLKTLFDQKEYERLLQVIDGKHWHPYQEIVDEVRLTTVIHLCESLLKNEEYDDVIFYLEHQLNISTKGPKVYSLLSDAYSHKGLIQKSLNLLSQGISFIEDREQAKLLEKKQLYIVDQHIAFLIKNEHWKELIKFIDSDPLPGSKKYYHYKLSTAQAYIQLLELNKAEEQLNLAAFEPELDPQIQKLRKEILKLRAELEKEQEIVELNDEEIVIPIKVKGDAIYVNLLLNEKVGVTLLLDTGASITHLSTQVMRNLGSKGVAQDGHRIFITASGKMKAPVAYLDLVQMEEAGVTNLLVAFSDIFSSDSGIDGLLGMNFLRFYNFSFDLDAEVLKLKHKEN